MAVSNRLFAWVIGRIHDQQPAASAEPLIDAANYGSIQGGDSVRLVPAVCRQQHNARTIGVAHAPWPLISARGAAGRRSVTHAAVVSAWLVESIVK